MGTYCLPPVGLLHIDTRAERLKVFSMSERVTELLYLGDRSRRISLPLTLMAEMGRWCGGNLSAAELQVVQRSGQSIRPRGARKQDEFSAGSRVIFTPANPGIRCSAPPSPHLASLLLEPLSLVSVGLSSAVGDNGGFSPAGEGNKIRVFN